MTLHIRSCSPRTALLGAALLIGTLAASAASAAGCDVVSYRLWQPNGVSWYGVGETIEIGAGEEGHIYVHVDSRSKSPYTTQAEIGYPSSFGFGGDARRVASMVRMEAQNSSDRQAGRIRLRAQKPGTTSLGYRLKGVSSPGRLDAVPPRCRTGQIRIEVLGSSSGGDGGGRPQPGGSRAEEAALSLVELLYEGILRRDRTSRDSYGFVDIVLQRERDGLMEVAEQMTTSEEFRREALRRTEGSSGRGDLARLRERLLNEMYRDLYGYVEPSRDDRDGDLEDLDICLSGDRDRFDACARLGRNLVGSRLFYDHNRRAIDDLRDGAVYRRR